MLRMTLAQVRSRIDRNQAHLLHVLARGLAINGHALTLQLGRHAAGTVIGKLEIQLVNPMLGRHLSRRRWCRSIVQRGATQAQDVRLGAERNVLLRNFDQRSSFSSCQGQGQLFFDPGQLADQTADLSVEIFKLVLVSDA